MREFKINRYREFVNVLYKSALPLDVYSKKGLVDIASTINPKLSGYQINNMIKTLWKAEGAKKFGFGKFESPEMSVFEDYIASVATPKKTTKKTSKKTTKKVKGKNVKMAKKVKGTKTTKKVVDENQEVSYVPVADKNYVKWGDYKTIDQVIKSKMFYPIFITGLSGNGKTMMVEQACAKNKREMYRVNITCRTDEDDLLGGFRLVDGQTIWFDGPVVKAMKTGAILLLDEIDLASDEIMCLQPILEGKGVFLKKINKFVQPTEGFQVFATANTKGQGDEHGKFVGTGFLNEAFLERFPVTVEQVYPKTVKLISSDPTVERGAYLVETLAHCGECHTSRNLIGGLQYEYWLGGAKNPAGKGIIPNITPVKLHWSEEEIVEYLTSGFTPDFDVAGGHMVDVIKNTSRLTEEDRLSIAKYLKAIPGVKK